MLITLCRGILLEKSASNSPEDYFNRSEVTYVDDGQERTLSVLYLRFFDEQLRNFTPYSSNPLFIAEGRNVFLHDIAAIVWMVKNPGFRNRKRVYISNGKEFASLFKGIDFKKLEVLFERLEKHNSFDLISLSEFSDAVNAN
ncbi:hypothetical protein [Peribacillus sp. SCS-155]|uniref:hypothetical protein n=1 Tax=Peribacillus sedimenti TaxID=3115297 RepID=UPI0039069115